MARKRPYSPRIREEALLGKGASCMGDILGNPSAHITALGSHPPSSRRLKVRWAFTSVLVILASPPMLALHTAGGDLASVPRSVYGYATVRLARLLLRRTNSM